MFELPIIFLASASTFALLGLGFLIGLRHAVEADHVAAVTTMLLERRSLISSAIVGGLWGLGHTIALLGVGILVLLMDFRISEDTERWLEFGVGVMLTLLGLNVLRKLASGEKLHVHKHEHGDGAHVHPHFHSSPPVSHELEHSILRSNPKAVAIGMVHGLAGSAALMLALIPTIDSKTVGLLYILVFGAGSIGGMMLMSLVVGLPFHLTAGRGRGLYRLLQGAAGLVSVALGAFIIYEKGFAAAA
jgi:ABC-type nickel/cobalt efflux system permease component RcnA